MTSRITALAGAATAVLAALAMASPAAAAPRRASSVDYVALGDSYSSGVGASGAGSCGRSPNGYPGLWDAANDPKSYKLAACGGATTATLRSSQLSALSDGTDLVTVTIGGNDAGFAPTLITCTVVGDSTCEDAVDVALQYVRAVLPGKLDATYDDIRERAPQAKVVVLGYPILFDTRSANCGVGGLSLRKRTALNAGAAALNDIVEARAKAAGFTWSDVTDEFDGHGVCAPQPWVRGLDVLNAGASFHPNDTGYRSGYLPALNDALD